MSCLIEVCCDTFKSVINADSSLAERIEICAGLQLGGLTPSTGFISKVRDFSKKKVNVLIRPRSGNFVYSDEEFELMRRDIIYCKTIGIDGIVSGVLLNNGIIDTTKTKELVQLAKPLTFTFHRAFDFCKNQKIAISDIIDCGADRILSSGQKSSIDEGLKNLIFLHKKYGDKIIIMPGGGLNKNNASLLAGEGIKEFHLSASVFEQEYEISKEKLISGFGFYKRNNKCGYLYSNKKVISDLFFELNKR
ncbi:MAG TPA: copper homeostasis protein CutC [Bacteroidales bacterium]|nr:copper homeostasis protein CutC [Bacteroidales bacterium]